MILSIALMLTTIACEPGGNLGTNRIGAHFTSRLRASHRAMIVFALSAACCFSGAFAFPGIAHAGNLMTQEILPSETDPSITRFNEPSLVVFDEETPADSPLVVFMPGTGGKPGNAMRLLRVVAAQGYRVIGLEYNDEPAVVQVCPRNPDPACSANFRARRIFGINGRSPVENTQAETIVNRLVKLLGYLQEHDEARHWDGYLLDGEPNWNRIVVSGLSQGAGMAAYIAKHKLVARVVLFSSPWDYVRASQLAPWIGEPSATPPDRWFAEYHRRENTAALLAHSYRTLQIPPDHIRIFDLDLPKDMKTTSDNPYHGSTIRIPDYASEWQFLFGKSP
jgi:predicted esterase